MNIVQGHDVLEKTDRIEYVKLQKNGKLITSSADDFDYYYSPASDKMYDKNTYHLTDGDEEPTVVTWDAMVEAYAEGVNSI